MRCQKGAASLRLFWEILSDLPRTCRGPAADLPRTCQPEIGPADPLRPSLGLLGWPAAWAQALAVAPPPQACQSKKTVEKAVVPKINFPKITRKFFIDFLYLPCHLHPKNSCGTPTLTWHPCRSQDDQQRGKQKMGVSGCLKEMTMIRPHV